MVDRKRIQLGFVLYSISGTLLFTSAIINLLTDNVSFRCTPNLSSDSLPPVEDVSPTRTPFSPENHDVHSFSQLPMMYRAVGFAFTIIIGPMLATRIGPGTSIVCVGVLMLPKYVWSLCDLSLGTDSHDFERHWAPVVLSICSGIGLGFFFAVVTRQTADIVVRMQNEHGLLASFNPIVSDADRRCIFCAVSTLLLFAVAAIPVANGFFLLLHETPFYRTTLNILTILLLFISICTYLVGLRQHHLSLVQYHINTMSLNLSRANLHVIVSDVVGALVQFMHSYTSRIQKASVLVIGILAFGFHEGFVYSLIINRCHNGTGFCSCGKRIEHNESLTVVVEIMPKTTKLCTFAQTAGVSMGTCMVVVMALCALFAWRCSRRRVHDVITAVFGCLLLLSSYGLMFLASNYNLPTKAEDTPTSEFDDGPYVELYMLLFAAGNALLRVTLYALVFNVFQVHVCVGYSICLFLECIACVGWMVLSSMLDLHWQILVQAFTVLIMLSTVAVLKRLDRRLRHSQAGLY